MLVKIEARILIFPGTDFHFPSTSVPPGTFFRLWHPACTFYLCRANGLGWMWQVCADDEVLEWVGVETAYVQCSEAPAEHALWSTCRRLRLRRSDGRQRRRHSSLAARRKVLRLCCQMRFRCLSTFRVSFHYLCRFSVYAHYFDFLCQNSSISYTGWRRINRTIQPFDRVHENLHKITLLTLVAHSNEPPRGYAKKFLSRSHEIASRGYGQTDGQTGTETDRDRQADIL